MAQQAQHPGGGAAGNAGVPQPPPLPVPTQVNATFTSKFQQDSNDPAGGDTAGLMNPWRYDIANAQSNTETTVLKNRLAASGSNRELIAISVFTEGKAKVYICPIRWDDGLVGTNPDLANQFIAIEGDLMFNQPHLVKIDSRSFNLINNTVAVLPVTAMSAAYTNDPTTELTGPNQPNDAGTEAKKSRPIIVLPHFLVPLFMAQPEGVSPRHFWTVIYPVIVQHGKEADCSALLEYFQIASTSNGQPGSPSVLTTTRPTPVARSVPVTVRYRSILGVHFPELDEDASSQQASEIAKAIGSFAQQNQEHFTALHEEREAKKHNVVANKFGKMKFGKLLRLLGLTSEEQLNGLVPVYKQYTEAVKSEKLNTVQGLIDEALKDRGYQHLKFLMTPGVLESAMSLKWDRGNDSSIISGFLGNPFLFGAPDEEAMQAIIRTANMVYGGGSAINNSDAQALMKILINPPPPNSALDNFKRLEAVSSVFLPVGHPFLTHITDLVARWGDFAPKWQRVPFKPAEEYGAKDIYAVQYQAIRYGVYWEEMNYNVHQAVVPSSTELIQDIRLQKPWPPTLDETFRRNIKFPECCRVFNALCGVGQPSGGSATEFDVLNRNLTSLLNEVRQQNNQGHGTGGGTVGAGGGGGGAGHSGSGGHGDAGTRTVGVTVTNNAFNTGLFDEFRRRRQGGNVIKSSVIREKIATGVLPPLPISKALSTLQMCLPWHVKGTCGSNCGHKADHIPYSAAEYQPLVTWCGQNYPTGE